MEAIQDIIRRALAEDTGNGDHTSLACIPPDTTGIAQLIVKESCVLSGIEIARRVFEQVDERVKFHGKLTDGQKTEPGNIAFEVQGSVQSILKSERLALNILQRMSGISTRTARYVTLVEGTKARILDTRKTTPNMRVLEKIAVIAGGGYNHRMGLYDMIMIKDNHIDFAGGIQKAIESTHAYLDSAGLDLKIEIEVRNLQELQQVLDTGRVNRIMLDNFPLEILQRAIHLISGKYETEASGGITEETIRHVALTGVDFISVGALTHHVRSIDMSLKAIE